MALYPVINTDLLLFLSIVIKEKKFAKASQPKILQTISRYCNFFQFSILRRVRTRTRLSRTRSYLLQVRKNCIKNMVHALVLMLDGTS